VTSATATVKDKQHSRLLFAALALLLLIWSANFLFVKLALRELPLLAVLAFRYLLAGLFIAPLCFRHRTPAMGRWTRTDAFGLLAVGVLGLVGNQVLFVAALNSTSIAHGALISASAPIMVLLGAAALGRERFTPIRGAGVVIAAAGIVLLQAGRSGAVAATWRGDLLMLCSAVVFAGFNLAAKPLAARFGSLAVNAFGYLPSAVVAGVLLAAAAPASVTFHASGVAWASIVYMGAGTSVAGYLIYAYALRRLPASRVAVLVYLQPPLAALLAWAILGEAPGAMFVPSAVLVLGGVYAVER
jgi:drug/metabolite transporter (DMT)-like permease